MPGLDATVLDTIDHSLALGRILTDVRSDFILAPHYSAVFANVGDDLWGEVRQSLRAGTFEPEMPITVEVPKATGITRPGSILPPRDRLVYQVLVDIMAPIAEGVIDRDRVFSNALLSPDPNHEMFQPAYQCWERLQHAVAVHCRNRALTHVVKADVASFFERLYQHNLVNLLHGCSCPAGAVNLLEKLLLAWTGKDSHGIVQGLFPSDFLGNFYLAGFDSDCAVRDVPSARYVDDIYLFFRSRHQARQGLVDLTRALRREDLSLNDRKTYIIETPHLLSQETELDRLFTAAREEVEANRTTEDWYGYQAMWLPEEDQEGEVLQAQTVEALYSTIAEAEPFTADKIERFCLPNLAAAQSASAVERACEGLIERPHLSKIYISYLAAIGLANSDVAIALEDMICEETLPYDWQLMWLLGALMRREEVSHATQNAIARILMDGTRPQVLRGLGAIALGKLGTAPHRRNLKHQYADEQSAYVRGAILFASRYFPAAERRTALAAWAGHSRTNSFIAEAVRRLTQ